MRVLVVDNDPEILECLTWCLARGGIDVRSYLSLGGPLPVTHDWSPEVIVSALEMPPIGSDVAIAHIAARHPGVPMIAMTSQAPTDAHGLARYGVCGVLARPFGYEDLMARLVRLANDTEQASALSP